MHNTFFNKKQSWWLDPHRHVKIWLSRDPSSFLNIENQFRFIRMRVKNPHIAIYFVYDSFLLNSNSIDKLKIFCHTHQIISKDLRHDIFPKCITQTERELLDIYEEEINHLDKGGNLGVASDILRWLAPIYTLGIYSDFDVDIDTCDLYDYIKIKVSAPVLLNIGTIKTKTIVNNLTQIGIKSNNDIIAVIDASHPIIEQIQEDILYSYKHHQNAYARCINEYKPLLLQISLGKSSLQTRQAIIKITKDNRQFAKFFGLYRQNIPTYLPKDVIESLVQLKKSENNPSILLYPEIREIVRHNLLTICSIHTAGSGIFKNTINRLGFDGENTLIFSFSRYAYISKNKQMRMYMTQEYYSTMTNSDFSWQEYGIEAIKTREDQIKDSAKVITNFFCKNKKIHQAYAQASYLTLMWKYLNRHEVFFTLIIIICLLKIQSSPCKQPMLATPDTESNQDTHHSDPALITLLASFNP